jgi:hypothetical protein
MTMRSILIGVCAVSALLLRTVPTTAQMPFRLENRAGRATFTNDLPVDAAVLYRVNIDSVTWLTRSLRVPARSSMPLPPSEQTSQVLAERIEPLQANVGIRTRVAAECSDANATDLQAAIRMLEGEANAPALEGSKEAADMIAAATQLAQLRLERTRDSLDLQRNSMVAFAARMQSVGTKSGAELAKQIDSDRQESLNQTIETIGYAAFAYAEAASAKYEVLSRDADRFKSLLENSEKAMKGVRRQIQLIADHVAATGGFQEDVMKALAFPTRVDLEPTIARDARVRRDCSRAATVDDRIVVTGITTGALATLRGEARFSDGQRQPIVLRRITGTTDWLGTVAWPPGSNRAALRVQTPAGRWVDIRGILDAGRPSLRDTEAELARDVEKARKRFKEAEFRAQGADHIKSVIIP